MLSIIILAAGKGSRMKSDTPKVLHHLCNKPMIHHIIETAKEISDDIEVVLFHQKERVYESINHYKVKSVVQDHVNYPGTGGAVMCCDPIHEKVLILNGDMPLIDVKSIRSFLETDADIVMGTISLSNPEGYGRVIIEEGEVSRIVEQKDANEKEKQVNTVNSGVYLIKKEILDTLLPQITDNNAQKEFYLTDIISLAKQARYSVKAVFVQEKRFKGVNSKRDLAQAESMMLEEIRNDWMDKGVIMHLPETIFIDKETTFIGECELDSGVKITQSVIEKSHIKTHSVIEEAHIIDSEVGPMARIRPKSSIIDSKIGNFVEIKKSRLEGVKAGHLSYLGDSEIGSGSNIGAGVITCNYDGKQKHQTKIGKNVFVGSDVQLIAPVKIEDDVLIAAGTTVTKNIPKGTLSISRMKQSNKHDFYYKFFKEDEK